LAPAPHPHDLLAVRAARGTARIALGDEEDISLADGLAVAPSTGIIIGPKIGPLVSTACVASPSEGACMDWLNKAWRFLKNETNQKTLAFIGGGIAAVVIGGWQFYTHFAQPTPADKPAPVVTVNGGGVGSGGNLNITQTGSGTLNVGGVHGVPPEDFQRVSKELGVTKAALASFFNVLEKRKVAPEDLDSTLREFAKRYKQLEED